MMTFRRRIILSCTCLVFLATALAVRHLYPPHPIPENVGTDHAPPADPSANTFGTWTLATVADLHTRLVNWLAAPDAPTHISVILAAASFIVALYLCVFVYTKARRDLRQLRTGITALPHDDRDPDPLTFNYKEFHDCGQELETVAKQLRDRHSWLTANAFRDHLTGLWNRKPFTDALGREVAFALRNGRPLSLIMVDLDHFKKFNDKYGHQAGDLVLKHTASRLASLVREGNVIARLGGEEFAIILPGTELDKAAKIAQQLCNALRCDALAVGGQLLRFSASFGVGELHECRISDSETFLHCADMALYDAKRKGRDTVATAPAVDAARRDSRQKQMENESSQANRPDHQREIRINRDTLALMGSTFSILQAMPDKHRVAHDMIQQVAAILRADNAFLFLLDEQRQSLTAAASIGTLACEDIPEIDLNRQPEHWLDTLAANQMAYQPDPKDPILAAVSNTPDPETALYIPVVTDGDFSGLIVITDLPPDLNSIQKNETVLKAVCAIGATALLNCDLYGQFEDRWIGSIEALCAANEGQDAYRKNHSARVGPVAVGIAEMLGQRDKQQLKTLRLAGFLLDIGMIGVPPRIRQKKRGLRESERSIMQNHCRIGSAIIGDVAGMSQLANIVLHHHEHYDGRGYPDRLAGQEIPSESRILAVADAYIAMTSDRPYRPAMTHEQTVQKILDASGTQFDPRVVAAFIEWSDAQSDQYDRPADTDSGDQSQPQPLATTS